MNAFGATRTRGSRLHLLVLGLSPSNIPLLQAARDNYEICIIGSDRSPQAAGKGYVDIFLNMSHQDANGIARCLHQRGIHACEILLGTTTDAAFETLVVLGEALSSKGFPPLSTIRRCRDKILLDRWLAQNGFNYLLSGSISSEIPKRYPVVVKGINAKNGPVHRLQTAEQLAAFKTKNSSELGKWIAQREVRGSEYRIDIFPGECFLILRHEGAEIYRNLLKKDLCAESKLALECAIAFHRKSELDGQIVKYDVIVEGETPYLIDVGFDHPLRFAAICKAIGASYWKAHLSHGLDNRSLFSDIVEGIQNRYYVKGSVCTTSVGDLP